MKRRSALGKQGEQIAAAYLRRQGYALVGANWRCPPGSPTQGEFDVIARQGETLVFVEVRTRSEGIEAAFESITPRKRQILERTAYLYLNEHQIDSDTADWRIDVIAVTLTPNGTPSVEHIENALDW